MSAHSIIHYVKDGEHHWAIRVGDDLIEDNSIGYKTREEMLNALFGLFFGAYDESFLSLYAEWHPPNDEEQPIPFEEPVMVPEVSREEAIDPATGLPWGEA